MGLTGGLTWLADLLFGERNVLRETVEVFRPNAEAADQRKHAYSEATLAQFADEFAKGRGGWFDRAIDGLNRVPRPAMALGTLGLFVAAMADPVWFAARMQGIALVPEPLWWLMGAIVSFYFGARHQAKSQEFQRSIAATLVRAPRVTESLAALRALEAGVSEPPESEVARGAEGAQATARSARPNAALAEWRQDDDRG
jgi:hypothetical protein